jgi:hypothetical protein
VSAVPELDRTHREMEHVYVRNDDYTSDHNVRAYRMGIALKAAAQHPAGDLIDTGLALGVELEKQGFKLVQVMK